MSDFQDVQIFSFATPLTVLDFSYEEEKLDVLIKLNKNFLEKMRLSAGYAFQSSRNSAPSFKFGAATATTVPVASRTPFFGETGDKPSNQPTNSFQFNAIPCFYISDGSQFPTNGGSTIKNRNIKKAVRRRK